MTNKYYIKLLCFGLIFCLHGNYVFAGHKHKISLNKFKNPANWNKTYLPANILAARLKHLLSQAQVVILLPEVNKSPNNTQGPLSDDRINENGLQYSYRGQNNNNLLNNAGSKRFYPFIDNGLYKGVPNYQNSKQNINYVNEHRNFKILPIQDSMDNQQEVEPNKMPALEVDPVPWPVRMGGEPTNGTLFEIKGQIIKFNPGTDSNLIDKNDLSKKQNNENAELEVMMQIVQKKTGRIIKEKKFKSFSNSGQRSFAVDMDTHYDKWNQDEPSSMSLAISQLTNEMVSYIKKLLLKFPLEGDIISLKNGEVLINLGKQNGVKVGDKFHVYSVGLGLNDPFTENDLGDIYVKVGVLKVRQILLGYSRALTIVGKDFFPGDTVRFIEVNN